MITQNADAFLNSFVKYPDNHFADVDISNHVKVENQSEKEYQKLPNDQKNLKIKTKTDDYLAAIQIDLNTKADNSFIFQIIV